MKLYDLIPIFQEVNHPLIFLGILNNNGLNIFGLLLLRVIDIVNFLQKVDLYKSINEGYLLIKGANIKI